MTELSIATGALVSGNDLATAVVISLFTDRLAEPSDQLPSGSDDRRGWYGDTWFAAQHPGDRIGSRLWLLPGTVTTDKTPLTARGYCQEALAWMIEDGIAERVDVDAFFILGRRDRLGIVIDIWRPGTVTPASFRFERFDWVWQQITTGIEINPGYALPP